MGCWKKLKDEEAVQIRSMNALCALGLRGFPIAERAHPLWNDYLRAVDGSGLKLSTLKLTLLINSGRGPYHSGKNNFTIEKATLHLLANCTDDFLQSLAEPVWRDKGAKGRCPASVSREDWLNARGIRTRLKEDSWARLRHSVRSAATKIQV